MSCTIVPEHHICHSLYQSITSHQSCTCTRALHPISHAFTCTVPKLHSSQALVPEVNIWHALVPELHSCHAHVSEQHSSHAIVTEPHSSHTQSFTVVMQLFQSCIAVMHLWQSFTLLCTGIRARQKLHNSTRAAQQSCTIKCTFPDS
jgi:hypothetical protein